MGLGRVMADLTEEKAHDEIDLFEHLARKKREVAAIAEAAEVAREQAVALLRLQRQAAAADMETYVTEHASNHEELAPLKAGAAGAVAPALPDASSSLSAEDRRRFGLDEPMPEPLLPELLAGKAFENHELSQGGHLPTR